MDWVFRHSAFIGAAAGALTFVTWTFYLSLFWFGYRRQRRASIIIGRGAGTGLDALCLVSNMSAQPVLIEGVIVVAACGEERRAAAVTSLLDIGENSPHRARPTREGPLKTGEYIVIGTFSDLLALADGDCLRSATVESPEVWIVAEFSSERGVVFARRNFAVARDGGRTLLRPTGLETRRITRASERREVEQALQEHLEEAVPERC